MPPPDARSLPALGPVPRRRDVLFSAADRAGLAALLSVAERAPRHMPQSACELIVQFVTYRCRFGIGWFELERTRRIGAPQGGADEMCVAPSDSDDTDADPVANRTRSRTAPALRRSSRLAKRRRRA